MNSTRGRHKVGRAVIAGILTMHALIHLMGTAKGLGLAPVPQLTQQIPPGLAVLWAVAAVLLLTAAVHILARSQKWWIYGTAGVLVSQIVIVTSWSDAAYGTIANVAILAGALFTYFSRGPRLSF